nr:MAG TPA: hypothetical protein [Caudoviricetes sp.]
MSFDFNRFLSYSHFVHHIKPVKACLFIKN